MKEIEKMSFEEAINELETIIKSIDSGNETLESAIKNFEKGIELKKHCEKTLHNAKLKIEKISKNGEEYQIQECNIE